MITALSLYTVVIAVMLVTISSLFIEPAAAPLPPITYVPIFQSDALVNQWAAEGLNIDKFENVAQTAEALPKEALSFVVTDDSGSHQVSIFLYEKVAGIVNDRHRLTGLLENGKNQLDIIQTAVIVYPADMNEATVKLLVSVFNAPPADSV